MYVEVIYFLIGLIFISTVLSIYYKNFKKGIYVFHWKYVITKKKSPALFWLFTISSFIFSLISLVILFIVVFKN